MVDPKPLIVITGSSGYLGTQIASLFREEYEVVGLDILPPANKNSVLRFFRDRSWGPRKH
jgi:nucleoside-diphosphate-sugar epimerase